MELTIREAAERLGVSANTIRRRLKAGELAGRQEPQGKRGYRWMVQLPDNPLAATPAVANGAPGMHTAMAYELADSRARIEGLERLIDEIASQREKLERERDDWKAAAQREGEASRELRVLLNGAQDSTRTLTATIEPQVKYRRHKKRDARPRTRQTRPKGHWIQTSGNVCGGCLQGDEVVGRFWRMPGSTAAIIIPLRSLSAH